MFQFQRAYRIWNTFWRMPGSRGFGVLLAVFVAVVLGSIWLLAEYQVDPADGERIHLAEAVYAVYCMLSFDSVYTLPRQWHTALVFFVLPLMGLLVLGHGLVRVGRALFDRKAWEVAMASTYRDHVIVCGLGKVGYRVIRWLQHLGEPVVGIEVAEDAGFVDQLRKSKVLVVTADAREADTLEKAGVAGASAIVPCADDDLTNLAIALEARRLNPQIKVVLRLFDDRLAGSVRHGFNIQTAFSTSALSAPAFAAAATRAHVDYAFSFGGVEDPASALLAISRFTVTAESKLVGYSLGQLEREFQVAILMHRHHETTRIHPPSDAALAAEDSFVVSAEIDALRRLSEHTAPPQLAEH